MEKYRVSKKKKTPSQKNKANPNITNLTICLNNNVEKPSMAAGTTATVITPSEPPSKQSARSLSSSYHWEESVFFLEQYKENEYKFKSVNYKNKEIWEDMADGIKK